MNDHADTLDLLIHGGTVIDGTRSPRLDADVGIAGGRIVAPGFIDWHTHDDQALLSRPDMSFKVSHAVTTVVACNCGVNVAPLAPDTSLPPTTKSRHAPPKGSTPLSSTASIPWRDSRHSGARGGAVLRRDPNAPRRSASPVPDGILAVTDGRPLSRWLTIVGNSPL